MLPYYLWLKTWLDAEEAQDIIEYAAVVALVAVAAIIALSVVGSNISTVFGTVEGWFSGFAP